MAIQTAGDQTIGTRFRVADWLVELRLNRISRGGSSVQLELKAMDVLLCLAERSGELVEKREILDEVWQTEFVSDNTLARRVAELREAFGDDARNPRYIETIPKRGYRLIAEISECDDSVAVINPGLMGVTGDDSPYPGLASYTESEAEIFFGRENEIVRLWRRIASHRLLAVIGPSGVGKSSLMRAGVIAHAPPGWRAVVCQPGEEPFLDLARALAPDLSGDPDEMRQLLAFHDPDAALAVVSRWRARFDEALIVVDQFEELFNQNPERVRDEFVGLLRRLVDGAGIHVVLVLRDDFLFECHRHPELAPVFRDLTAVGPPPPAGLRRALVEPAASRLFAFEDELLVEEMVAEVETERGALPLLAFAVACLWELRDEDRRMLTRQAYEAVGGVAGALARHAEATLEAIGWERLPIVRELFRNLVTSQGTRAVRRVDDMLSIFDEQGGDDAVSVLSMLVDARLLTSFEEATSDDDETPAVRRVEIVHESLLRAWPRLVRWQTQEADAAQLRDQLRQAAKLWSDRGRPDDLLWSGPSLREFQVWRDRYLGGLSATEEAFAGAMVRQAERRRRVRRVVTAAVTLVALIVAAVTTSLWRRSEQNARRLEARRFSETARQLMERAPPEAFVNARKSLEFMDTPEARRLVTQALWRSPMPVAVDTRDSEKYPISASFSPDKPWLAVGNTAGELWLLPHDGGEQRRWPAHASPVGFQFTPEPSVIVSHAMGDPASVFWSVPDGTRLGEEYALGERLPTHVSSVDAYGVIRAVRFVTDPEAPGGWSIDPRALRLREGLQRDHPPRSALAPDGRVLILAQGPELAAADVEAPDLPPVVVGRCGSNVRQVVFAPDGRVFATADAGGSIDVWAFAGNTANRIRSWQGLVGDDIHHLGFDRSGRLLVASYDIGGVQVFGLDDPPGADPLRIRPGGSRVIQSTFDPTNRWLVTAAMGRLAVWPLDRSRHPYILRGHSGSVDRLEFGPNGDFLVSAATDGTVRYWPLRITAGDAPRVLHDWKIPIEVLVAWVDVSDDGRVVVATGNQNHVRVIPLDGRSAFDLTEADQRIIRAAVSPDGRLVAVVGRFDDHYEIKVCDIESQTERSIELPQDLGWPPLTIPVVFTKDGRLLGSIADRVHEWDLETAEGRRILDGVGTMGLDELGHTLIGRSEGGGSGEPVATVYSLDEGHSSRLSNHGGRVNAVALDPTGTIAVTGDYLGGIRVGPTTGETPHLLSTDDVYVGAVAVSSDARWIASGYGDGTIRIWPMPDLSKPPLYALPYPELMARLNALSNLTLVDDPQNPGDYLVRTGPFPGWESAPEW